MKNFLTLSLCMFLGTGFINASPLPVKNNENDKPYSQNFYSKSTGNLELLSTWGANPDGSGASPADFVSSNQTFTVVNQTNATLGGNFGISGTGSKLIIGDGIQTVMVTIPSNFSISSTTVVDVAGNATLEMQNKIMPALSTLMTGSTVSFAQSGVSASDTVKIPALVFYNLTLKSGLKYFSTGTTTVNGNLTADAVTSLNGERTSLSKVNLMGNFALTNGSQFESIGTGDNARFILAMNGSAGSQNINGNGNDISLYSLIRDSITTNDNITLSSSTNLFLGNDNGGGLSLNQGTSTITKLTLGFNDLNIIGASSIDPAALGIIGTTNGTLNILKSAGSTNAGTARFATGTVLSQLIINLDPSVTKDSLVIANNVSVSSLLNLNKGKVVLAPGVMLSLKTNAIAVGASVASFIDGKVAKSGSDDFIFPVGKGSKYSPVEFYNIATPGTFSVQYFSNGYSSNTINSETLANYPNYKVSTIEYWTTTQSGASSADLVFDYNDGYSQVISPSLLRIAQFQTTDWNDLGGTPDPSNTTTVGNVRVNNVASFSSFTFAAANAGVLPIKLSSFAAQKVSSTVQLNWVTEAEINSTYFDVERSNDQKNWMSIGKVNASGNSAGKNQYSLLDANPVKGINFYRLKMVSKDGSVSYSYIRSVSFTKNISVTIFPNPANDYINITLLKNDVQPVTVNLVDINGKVVNHLVTSQSYIKLNATGLAKGSYFIKILNGNEVTTEKIVLQ